MLKFMLSSLRRGDYTPANKLELTGKDGGPLLSGVVILPDNGREPLLEATTPEAELAYYELKIKELQAENAVDGEVVDPIVDG